MKKNILYLSILLSISVLVYFVIFKNPNSTFGVNDNEFAYEDTAAIHKIFISDVNGTHLTYIRNASNWTMQENGLPVRRDVIDIMLRTIKNFSVRYPVAQSALESSIKDIASNNKKVELYNEAGKKVRSFFIGPPSPDGKGNYMLVEKAQKPYVVWNTGFVGSLETRFSADINEVRSRLMLAIPFPSLAEIRVQYSDPTAASFSINVQKPDSFLITNLNTHQTLPVRLINKEKVFEYIDFLKAVYCEAIISNEDEKLKAVSTTPFCVISIRLRNGGEQQMKCYFKEITKRSKSQSDAHGTPRPYDLDRFYGTLNGSNEVYLLQDYHFGKLLQTFDYFKK